MVLLYVNNPEQMKYAVACDGNYNVLGVFNINYWEAAKNVRNDIADINSKMQFGDVLNSELTAQLKEKIYI